MEVPSGAGGDDEEVGGCMVRVDEGKVVAVAEGKVVAVAEDDPDWLVLAMLKYADAAASGL